MALSSELRVYKDTYQMTLFIMECVDNSQKAYKHNFCNRLIDKVLSCLENLLDFRASINSCLGFFKHGGNYAMKRKIIGKLNKK